jgi:hypothetical protein
MQDGYRRMPGIGEKWQFVVILQLFVLDLAYLCVRYPIAFKTGSFGIQRVAALATSGRRTHGFWLRQAILVHLPEVCGPREIQLSLNPFKMTRSSLCSTNPLPISLK